MTLTASVLTTIRSQMSKIRICGAHDKVYKDECVVSFDSPFSDGGLFVNISTFQGFGSDFVSSDVSKGGKLYVHQKWLQVPKPPVAVPTEGSAEGEAPSKLAIGIAGGFVTESEFDIIKVNSLAVVNASGGFDFIPLPNLELPEFVSNAAQAIIDHDGMRAKLQANVWDADNEKVESKYARSLIQLSTGKKISQDPTSWRCEESGDTNNLWLNLSTGYIGGGRKNWDGSGGSGAALKHFQETGGLYPLCVKLGTITAHGADVWSYAPDEDTLVIDPLLSAHLSHWGIDIMKLEKTDKSLTEMEVALNMKYDWTRILEDGEKLEPLSGPGLVGLRNIGSTCYMNSVLQPLLSIPEVSERYLSNRQVLLVTAPADPTADLGVQLSKLAEALLTSRYVPTEADKEIFKAKATEIREGDGEAQGPSFAVPEKCIIAPRMLKQLVGQGTHFASGHQQDASEYFMHFLEFLNRAERTLLPRIGLAGAALTSSIFEFTTETRLECHETRRVKYLSGKKSIANTLELRIPMDAAVNRDEVERHNESKRARVEENPAAALDPDDDVKLVIPFERCLETFFSPEVVAFRSQGVVRPATRTTKLKTFPRYLMVKLGRYYVGPNWVQVKIDARVPAPEHLDLRGLRGQGIQPGEEPFPEEDSASAVSDAPAASAAIVVPDEEIVAQLVSMGFSENGCRRAALATHNSNADAAMNWIFEHMEDADFNSPLPDPAAASTSAPAASSSGSEDFSEDTLEKIGMIASMGYTELQARAALKATDNNLERAMDWIFSHTDDLDAAVAAQSSAAAEGSSVAGAAAAGGPPADVLDDGEGTYSLMAIISHMGSNTEHGHYVCHIKKGADWCLFNDEKVARSKNPPLEFGFMYLYKRNDGTGTLLV